MMIILQGALLAITEGNTVANMPDEYTWIGQATLGTWPVMPLVGGFFVLLFGGLTLALDDSFFIKIKPTIVNLLFAGILATGVLLGRNFLKIMFGNALILDDSGWRVLTLRWIGFFVVLAILNEVTRRYFSDDMWVTFKTFGIMPLTLLFTLFQFPLIKRHWAGEKNPFA